MKIQFGTAMNTHSIVTTFFLGFFVFAINWFNSSLLASFGESEKSILHSRKLNSTHKPDILYCDLSYDDCLCSVLLNKSNTSANCIAYDELLVSRILPLISFFLQIFLVRELFSLITDRCRAIIYVLWIASIFTLISMTISIYWSSCYHVYITFILFLTSGLLLFLSLHNLLVNADRQRSSSNRNQPTIVNRSEKVIVRVDSGKNYHEIKITMCFFCI
jgi:membrane protein implicated in regulation of membrane protease activity